MTGIKVRNIKSIFDPLTLECDAWYDGEGRLIFLNELEAFKPLLSLLPHPWLEIDMGSGRFAQALGIESGTDPSIGNVKLARQRDIVAFLGQGHDKIFEDSAFGTIFLIATPCFLPFTLKIFREARRILRPGGKLVTGFVPREGPWGYHLLQQKLEGHLLYKYATFYCYQEVERLISNSGFHIEKVISTLFQKPGDAHTIEDPREGIFAEAGFEVIEAEKTKEGLVNNRTLENK